MSSLFMLVGVPGSGKSTWIKQQVLFEDVHIASTDDIITRYANAQGKTYNEVFHEHIKAAEKEMYAGVMEAVKRNQDIIWDQTNTSRKSRAKKLILIPDRYRKVGVFFPTPSMEELERRNASRPGKVIPWGVMQNMIDCLNQPMLDEGFDEVQVAKFTAGIADLAVDYHLREW